MAARDFPRFRDLPVELRLQIWSYCIPGPRVVEMDYPLSDNHLTLPAGPHTRELWSSLAGRAPLVARVCHEARSVALNRVQYVPNDNGTDEDGMPCPLWASEWGVELTSLRLRKGVDILHLNWHYGYDHYNQLGPDPPPPWLTFQWLVDRAATVSISADLLLPFDPERGNPYTTFTSFGGEDIWFLGSPRLHYAVLAIVEIHISAEEAAQAGVFGILGEEPIKLVHPRDTVTIAKFRDVWQRHQAGLPSSKELDVGEFFSTAIERTENYCARVEQWRQNLDKVWLYRKSFILNIPWEIRKEFFPNWLAATEDENDYDPDSGVQVQIPHGWSFDWNRRVLNREHPWVQTQLALMPPFEPAIMFRHCVGWCGQTGYANRTLYLPSRGGMKRVERTEGAFRDIAMRRVE